jgi:hypothetical protein
MNILAKRKGSQIADADAVPTLFFIECSNIDEDMASLCCPILEPSKDAGMLSLKFRSRYIILPHMAT